MDKEGAKRDYGAMTTEELIKEKQIQEAKKADAYARHEKAVGDMVSPIVMASIGLVFIWLLPLSIPLLVIGIPRIVDASKARNSSNHEYNEACWRLNLLDSLMRERKVSPEKEEVSGEVIG